MMFSVEMLTRRESQASTAADGRLVQLQQNACQPSHSAHLSENHAVLSETQQGRDTMPRGARSVNGTSNRPRCKCEFKSSKVQKFKFFWGKRK